MPVDQELLNYGARKFEAQPSREDGLVDVSLLAWAEERLAQYEQEPEPYIAPRDIERQQEFELHQERLEYAREQLARSPLPGFKAYAIEAGADIVGTGARAGGFVGIPGATEYADAMNRFAEYVEIAATERDERTTGPAWLKRAVRGAGRSLTTVAPLAMSPAGPYGAIAAASAQETNRAITEGKDAGLTGSDLAGYAIRQGLVEAAPASIMQATGFGGLEKLLSQRVVGQGVKQGLKRLGIATAQELVEENITELSHNVVAALEGVDPEAISSKNILRTIADTTAQTFVTMGFAQAIAAGRKADSEFAGIAGVADVVLKHHSEGTVPSRKEWKALGLNPVLYRSQEKKAKFVVEAAKHISQITEGLAAQAPQAAVEALGRQEAVLSPEAVQEGVVGPEWEVFKVGDTTVVKNPTTADRREMADEFRKKYPDAPRGEPKTRKTVDTEGNEYIWLSDKTHPQIEPGISRRIGIAVDQNAPKKVKPAVEKAPTERGIDFVVEMEGTGERIGHREVVRDMERIWGKEFGIGRLTSKKARGEYHVKEEHLRLAKGELASPAVAIHELAHHMAREQKGKRGPLHEMPYEAQEELERLDYEPEKAREGEGFAEYVRGLVTGSIALQKNVDVREEAPEFTKVFDAFLEQNPDIKLKIERSKGYVSRLQAAGAVGRAKGAISRTGLDESKIDEPRRKRWAQVRDWAMTRIKEEGLPIQRVVEEAKRRGFKAVEAIKDPFQLWNFYRRTGTNFTANAFEEGVFLLTDFGKRVSASMKEILSEIDTKNIYKDDSDYTNFITWTYARHAIESWSKGKDPGITLTDAKATEAKLYEARYERAADNLTQFNNAMLDVLVDVGALDAETAETMISYYDTYIPLQRARKRGFFRGGAQQKMVNLGPAIHGRKGSALQIIDPLEATLQRTVKLYERAAQHQVMQAMIKMARETEGMGDWIHEVPPNVIAHHFQLEEIKGQILKAMEKDGSPDSREQMETLLDGMDPLEALLVWRPDLAVINGENIVRVEHEGEKKFYQIHPDLYEAVGGLENWTDSDLNIVNRVAKASTGLYKFGATRANPSFQLTNALKDIQVFLLQGEKGLRGAFDPAKAAALYMASELNRMQGGEGYPVIRLFQQGGGELSTYVGLDRDATKKSIRRANAGAPSQIDMAKAWLNTTEVSSRIAEFTAILEKNGWLERVKKGETPPADVIIQAVNAAHDVTTDFRRMGKWGRYLNYYIPFLNARMEGVAKTYRTFKEKPARTTIRLATQRLPMILMYWWYCHDDDDYKEREEWQDAFYIFRDEAGKQIWRIPKPHEWGLFDSGVERILDAFYERDPKYINRWFKQALKTTLPSTDPSVITPILETMFNYSLFKERPIISEALQKLEAPEQYYEHTSNVAKDAARILYDISGGRVSLSPAKMDHLADGLSGGLYRRVGAPVEKTFGTDEWTISDVPGFKGVTFRKEYHKSVNDFYDAAAQASKLHESNKVLIEQGREPRDEDATVWQRLEAARSLMTDMRKAARPLSNDERRRTEAAMTGLARQALDRDPLGSYKNPFVDMKGLPQPVQDSVDVHLGRKAYTAAMTAKTKKAYENKQAAITYLTSMGVTNPKAQAALYKRLMKSGMGVGYAKKRAQQIPPLSK